MLRASHLFFLAAILLFAATRWQAFHRSVRQQKKPAALTLHLSPPPPPISAASTQSPTPPRTSCAALSPERARAGAAASGFVVATFVNEAQSDFGRNWLWHVDNVGLTPLIGATDAAAEKALGYDARCFALRSEIGAAEAKWGSPGFAQMGRTKSLLVRTFLSYNVTLFFADVDVVLLRDPRPYIDAALADGAQLLFHTDGFGASDEAIADGGLELPKYGFTPEMNTGLFLATPAALPLAAAWCDALKSDSAFANWLNDQQALNKLLRRGAWMPPRREAVGASPFRHRLIAAFDGSLRLGLLPAHLFPSGHVFFIQRQPRIVRQTPLAVHLTFQNCDQSGKRHRIREARLWAVDPPEYYDPPGGLLSFTPDLPPELTGGFNASLLPSRNLRADDAILAAHFRLVNHQLTQVRTALAIALALGRTLVLPRLLCGLETVTNFAHSGVRCRGSFGCRMRLPYWCPADHVLRMHYLAGVMPQRAKVPLPIREHSALLHPSSPVRRPARVLFGDVDGAPARACAAADCAGDEGAYLASAPETAATVLAEARASGKSGAVKLPAREVDEAEARALLGADGRHGLVHISSLRADGFRVRLDERRRDAFTESMKPLGGGWCCIQAERGGFGHYWYDALHDVVPHTDRFNRKWDAARPWRPVAGP